MSELTERERWLISKAFKEGFEYGLMADAENVYDEPAQFHPSMPKDWLNDSAADGVTVADVLAKEAPRNQPWK